MISEPVYTSNAISATKFSTLSLSNHNIEIIGLTLSLLLIGIVSATEKRKIKYVFDSLISKANTTDSLQNKINFSDRSTLILLVNYLLSMALLFYEFNTKIEAFNSWQIVWFSLMLIIAFLIKRLVISFSGWLTNQTEVIKEYLLTQFTYTLAAGIILVPLLIIYKFMLHQSVFSLKSIIFLLGLFMLLRIAKTIVVASANKVSGLFYLFLYICTLEILPLVVIFKLLINQMS